MTESTVTLQIAAIADLHYDEKAGGSLRDLFTQVNEAAEVLALCGDLTDYGRPEEAEVLARDLHKHVRIPTVAVLGNHDFESGEPRAVRRAVEEAGVTVLDGESTTIKGVGFAGTSGFAGGFEQYALKAWGESVIKQFVQSAVDEVLKLERALARLEAQQRVALLHYAPIRETVVGEPPEIYPFLGSSRLEDPLNDYDAAAAFHGHAHHGTAKGHTTKGVPVYNVSLPLLQNERPDGPSFRLVEIDRPVEAG